MDASKPKKRDGGANVQKMRDCYYGQFLNGVATRVIQKMQAKCGGSAVWDTAHLIVSGRPFVVPEELRVSQ